MPAKSEKGYQSASYFVSNNRTLFPVVVRNDEVDAKADGVLSVVVFKLTNPNNLSPTDTAIGLHRWPCNFFDECREFVRSFRKQRSFLHGE